MNCKLAVSTTIFRISVDRGTPVDIQRIFRLKKVPTQQHTLITTPNDVLTIITFPLFKLLSPVIHLEFDYTTMEHYTPIGPISDNLLVDVYSLEKVRENHCVASVAKNISNYLTNKASDENIKYLAICIPAYNEEFEEMLKTLVTLMENVEFMKRKVVFCFLLLCLSFIFSFLSFSFFSFLFFSLLEGDEDIRVSRKRRFTR
jgi:hypothetical protein